jgi:hypothetical protein
MTETAKIILNNNDINIELITNSEQLELLDQLEESIDDIIKAQHILKKLERNKDIIINMLKNSIKKQ